MKHFICFAVIAALIAVACAHPAADAAADAKAAAKAGSDATAASGAVAKAGDDAKKANPKDALAAMTKNAKGLNPLIFAEEIKKFLATITEACQKFIQSIFGGSGAPGASPAGIPGMDEISSMSKLFNPLAADKDIFGNLLKAFGGADPFADKKDAAAGAKDAGSAVKDKADAAAGATAAAKKGPGTSDATAATGAAAKAGDDAKSASGGDFVSGIEDAGAKILSSVLGGFGKK